MLDRIAEIVLVVFGALLLVLLVLGLAVSCRGTSADTSIPSTVTVVTSPIPSGYPGPGTFPAPPPTPIVSGSSPTPTPAPGVGAVATQSPAPIAPGATVIPGVIPTSPAISGSGLTPGATVQHVVVRGEWLLQIARCYGIDYGPLRSANRLSNPDFILPGQVLTVPNIGSLGAISGPPCVIAYTVAAGDSWESLAQRYGTTAAILQRANPGALAVGRSIWVPRKP